MKKRFMEYRLKNFKLIVCMVVLASLSVQVPVFAKSSIAASGKHQNQRYIVVLDDPPLASYDGRVLATPERGGGSTSLAATSNQFTGASKLDVNSEVSQQYLKFLDERFKSFSGEANLKLGHQLQPTHRYRNALNGFATELSAADVKALRDMPRVKSVELDIIQKLTTDSGPDWIGAKTIHDGSAGFTPTGGEGVVVGVIDSGVNWDHLSFQDPGLPGWDHTNPYGSQLGLCSDPEVLCNDKLVGVYDFVVDTPGTPETEENTKGKDNSGHGSHVMSTAAGNPLNVTLEGIPAMVAGVAPNANIVSYRVCYIADPIDPNDDGCQTSAILSAIDRAIDDAVDVVNYSIGSGAQNPWTLSSSTFAFLSLRDAGIFVATSAGNAGPNAGTIGSPANAPWITAVGNATHDRVFASVLEGLTGGDTAPPGDLVGASLTSGIGIRKIVHARDFGNALCGTGPAESGASCAANTGASSPFAPGTFNGEIVVCDRGTYGRIEKGKNVMVGGAGGYILANTETWAEVTKADNHCLPGIHLGFKDGSKLSTWLDTGMNHQGSLSGFDIFNIPEAGDIISRSSSRGPGVSPVEDVLKPDVIAPGTEIVGAYIDQSNSFAYLTGTSMASPHVTGAAALLKAVHPDWTPSMINSALMMTATAELATDFDGSEMTTHKRGAGRPRLDMAANSGLFLDETRANFLAANPAFGGVPKDLNLPGLVDSTCAVSCAFQRTVTDLVGGASWTASSAGFDDGVTVAITPSNFSLADGASQMLDLNIDLTQFSDVNKWVYGDIVLSSPGRSDAVFPVAVFAAGGDLPSEWVINTDANSGLQDFTLDGLVGLPDATFTSGGLVKPTVTIEDLPEDPTWDDPYDGGGGTFTVLHDVPQGALWLHAETMASASQDVDLFVGRDDNNNGVAEEDEEICASTSENEIENCELFEPAEGRYWVLVQNWTSSSPGAVDELNLTSAVVSKETMSPLAASGNGISAIADSQDVRLSWDNVNVGPGTGLLGVVGIGTTRETPNNIGFIPVVFNRTGIADAETFVLMNGISRGLAIPASGSHDHIYVDVPPGASSLTISADGAANVQHKNLTMELYRMDFDDAFTNAPFATAPNTMGGPLATATGGGGIGPKVVVSGGDLVPGRWYAVLKNARAVAANVTMQADIGFSGTKIELLPGLWEATSRPDIRQGYDITPAGTHNALLWYTYSKEGTPVWYLAANAIEMGNVWVAELRRFTNDGTFQQSAPVGYVSVTSLARNDQVFSFVLFGEQGSDRTRPSLGVACPEPGGVKKSYYGIWSRPVDGLGGATVVVNGTSQGYVHYVYDDLGRPVWLNGSDGDGPDAREVPLFQWSGFCAVCSGPAPSYETVGVFTRDYASETSMTWNLDYMLNAPLVSSTNRTDDTVKITTPLVCP